MQVHRSEIGPTAGHAGQPPRLVEAYELDTETGLSIVVWTFGATLVEVRVPDRSGRIGNVVVRHARLQEYERREDNPYLGATMGRFCRNIAQGRFVLDGREHQLDCNDGRHHLHGGGIGFDRYVWDARVHKGPDSLSLRMRLVSPDGDQGYPGELAAETEYRVDTSGRLTITHRATTTKPTIVGFTNHAYWNLATAGQIDQQRLHLNAASRLAFDADLLPVPGPATAVTGTPFDFTAPKPLADVEVDNFFVLDDSDWAAVLDDPASGRRMRITTTEPGLGIYSLDQFARPRAGLCLQASPLPNAPNRPDFPPVRLDPGETYTSVTTHTFAWS